MNEHLRAVRDRFNNPYWRAIEDMVDATIHQDEVNALTDVVEALAEESESNRGWFLGCMRTNKQKDELIDRLGRRAADAEKTVAQQAERITRLSRAYRAQQAINRAYRNRMRQSAASPPRWAYDAIDALQDGDVEEG